MKHCKGNTTMTIYRSADAIYTAYTQDMSLAEPLAALLVVYFDAMHNPPDGVIGVGAITYAEQMLIAAQQ